MAELDANVKKILEDSLQKSEVFQAVQNRIKSQQSQATQSSAPTGAGAPNIGGMIGSIVGGLMPGGAGGLLGAAAGAGISQGINGAQKSMGNAGAQSGQQGVPHGTQTTSLPSDSSIGQGVLAPGTPVDMDAIQARARRDAQMQVDALRQKAEQGAGRYKAEGEAMIQALRAMYATQYAQNAINTEMGGRNAVQRQASRGFLSSGLAQDAEQKAYNAGEQQRMGLVAQETGQVGQINSGIMRSQSELQDMLNALAEREQGLQGQLSDQYLSQERDFGLRERGLDSQNALALMGMDQRYNEFNQGLSWDKDKFGQQMGFQQQQNQQQFGLQQKQLAENIAARMAQNSYQRDYMGMQDQWQNNSNQLQRDQMSQQNSQFGQDLGFRQSQWGQQYSLDQQRMAEAIAAREWQQNQQGSDNALGWAKLKADQDLENRRLSLDERGLNMAGQNATAGWMSHAQQLMRKAQGGDFDARAALGMNEGQGYNMSNLLGYYQKQQPMISAEGADMQALLDYIYRLHGQSMPNMGQGPRNKQNPYANMMDPLGYYTNR